MVSLQKAATENLTTKEEMDRLINLLQASKGLPKTENAQQALNLAYDKLLDDIGNRCMALGDQPQDTNLKRSSLTLLQKLAQHCQKPTASEDARIVVSIGTCLVEWSAALVALPGLQVDVHGTGPVQGPPPSFESRFRLESGRIWQIPWALGFGDRRPGNRHVSEGF